MFAGNILLPVLAFRPFPRKGSFPHFLFRSFVLYYNIFCSLLLKRGIFNESTYCTPVSPADAGKTVAQLLGEVETRSARTLVLEPGAYPSALVLANFKDKDVDTLLDLLKQAQVNIPLKAVVTPANRSWVFGDLLAHLQEEHTAFTAAKENQTR